MSAYSEGCWAFTNGGPISSVNPYDEGDERHYEWLRGWNWAKSMETEAKFRNINTENNVLDETGDNKEVVQNPKQDVGITKVPTSYIPAAVIQELGVAMLEGALKYGPFNWRESSVVVTTYIDAAKRHLDAFLEGREIDPDSGLCELTKAIASIVVLRDAMINGTIIDDRMPLKVDYDDFRNNLDSIVSEINKKYGSNN